MRCSKCGTDNAAGSRFCNQCATSLNKLCPKCASDNAPEARFCAQCAAPLEGASPIRAGAERSEGLTGERRHLTVLFCDLVGSTAIAAQLDPEEWRETVGEYHRVAAEAITRFGGHVVKYLGDGVMALFGWPEAHDNDAERAARAGLAIIDSISRLNELPGHAKLAARVGIDSGPVVMGKGAGGEIDVFGDAPNIAARVETAADPGMVLITAATQRLMPGMFAVEDLGARPLKGIEVPVQLYRVIQPSGVRGRLEATAAVRGLTPFVGREDELRLLMNRWERAMTGEGQVALIVGEAGIGKSRLVQRFHERIAGTPHTWIQCATAPFYQNTPFYPVAEVLRQLVWERSLDRLDDYLHELQGKERRRGRASARGGDPSAANEQFAQLESALALAGLDAAASIPLIAPLLNLTLPPEIAASSLPADQQRRRLLATLVEWMLGASRAQPLVIVTEDLHWADRSTLELIQTLVEQGARSSLLLLYTARPEFKVPWALRAHHTQITLNRLGARDVREMIEEVAAQKAMTAETVAAVVARTGGVPLFVEELTRAVLERGGDGANREIPATLHDSLMARLDRLGATAKEVAQVAAVIGREFPYELLHAVHPLAEGDLQSALAKLAEAELIYTRGIAPDATYTFKHALIQDAAYEALLKTRRSELHRKVAQTITEEFVEVAEAHPEVLARHWTEAGEIEFAIAAWSQAGRAAEARNAFGEALESYQQAVALTSQLPASKERDLRELELRQSAFVVLRLTKGFSAPEVIGAAERAVALAERSGNLAQFADWVMSRCLPTLIAGDAPSAATFADQALELALREGAPTRLANVYTLQMLTHYHGGDFAGAEEAFTAGLKFFDDPDFRQSARGGTVVALGIASWNAWALGRADVAREREAQMTVAANGNKPQNVAFSGQSAACLLAWLREYERAAASAAQALALSEKHQILYFAALSRCILGHARAQLGNETEGIDLILLGIDGLFEVGSRLGASRHTLYMAEAQERQGATVDALETIERALRANPNERADRPEILRVRGELRLKQGLPEQAERDFRDSIALAQAMSAKAWELRTTMSLARLLASQGRPDDARAMLAEIYTWFTEGFDTADLKDAKALLDELAA
jgi:class 3 adenylate cyclase/tetratricopeptide (TPR) repeat protein